MEHYWVSQGSCFDSVSSVSIVYCRLMYKSHIKERPDCNNITENRKIEQVSVMREGQTTCCVNSRPTNSSRHTMSKRHTTRSIRNRNQIVMKNLYTCSNTSIEAPMSSLTNREAIRYLRN